MNKKAVFQNILSNIDWKEIHDYYKKLDIIWNIESSGGKIISKVPEIIDIQEELYNIIEHLIESEEDYISYGNWVVFLDKINHTYRIIFRLADITINKKTKVSVIKDDYDINVLENRLRACIAKEEYEKAASLRDKISFLREIDNE